MSWRVTVLVLYHRESVHRLRYSNHVHLVWADQDESKTSSLYDLLSAYANLRQRNAITHVTIERRKVWSLVEARDLLNRMLGEIGDWTALQQYLLPYLPPQDRVTATASAFAASLELVREGQLEIRQDGAFQTIYLRKGPGRPKAETLPLKAGTAE